MAGRKKYPTEQFYKQKTRNLQKKCRRLETLFEESKIDSLTGVFGRTPHTLSEIRRFLSEANRNEEVVAIAMIDIDNFKIFNDKHGHHVGDTVLKRAARKILSCLRGSDLVARWGGDEFIALFSFKPNGVDPLTAASIPMDRLKKSIESSTSEPKFTLSIGYVIKDDSESFDIALKRADAKMYEDKLGEK